MKTLLNGVNEVLTRAGIIKGDSGTLTTLTDSARQNYIDTAVQVWNEAIDHLFSVSSTPLPKQQKSSTITLVTNQQDYTLQTDVVRLHFPLINRTNGDFIREISYDEILINDPEQDDTGQPLFGAISPIDSKLYLDRKPSSENNGAVYTYQYDSDLVVSAAADAMPFTDEVFRAMVPSVTEMWRRERQRAFDADILNVHFGRASRLLTGVLQKTSYNPR